jgi:hypothetical protein
MGEGEPGQAHQEREGCVYKPDKAESSDFAGVVFQLDLEAGHGGDYRCDGAAALRANRLTLD